MTHYRMLDKNPSAIICVDGNERKIYENNEIFLQNGENFQIRLFNPDQFKIGVEILFNGIKKNDGFLVLNPGEDINLDRFLGEKKKMKFDTYTIDGNNEQAVQAAALNGFIEFKFYKEKINNQFWSYSTTGTATLDNFGCSFTTDGNVGIGTSTPTSTFNVSSFSSPGISKTEIDNSNSDIETGRVEKGPESNQDLKIVDANFESYAFHTITYQLKPNSHKPQNITEIRNYCTKCGYRLRKNNWKFCPSCALPV